MATVAINNLYPKNQSTEQSEEMLQLSQEDAKEIVGGIAFTPYASLAFVPTDLQVAWCCCGGNRTLLA